MSVRRRTSKAWVGAVIVGAMLLSRHLAAADRPVHEVQIVASRFIYEPSTVQVSVGEAVRLVVRSKDGTHGFSIPKLNIDVHIPKNGEPVTVEFLAPSAGEYEIACSEFCGHGHAQMKAVLVSVASTRTSR
jgi:cytochrome c oxidase subunit 2